MYCPKCGTRIHEASQFCASCGTRLSDLGVGPIAGSASTADAQSTPPSVAPVASAAGGAAASTVNVYGGFWRRVAASLIDSAILVVAVMVAVVLTAGLTEDVAESGVTGLLVALAIYVGGWLYFALMESSGRQATLGKMALGIRVTDLNGQRIGLGRATGRYFGKYISSLTYAFGYVMAGFTQRRQALHDKIAGTLVLRKDTDAERLALHPVAPKVAGWAVVLLVVATGVLPVIGILAAIAIPAYQDYTIRAQVAEGLVSAATYKAAVVEAVANGMSWEEITSERLNLDTPAPSQYLQSNEVIYGAVVLTFGDQANSNIAGGRLVLVPGDSTSGEIVWVCGYGAAPEGVDLVIADHEKYTDVDPKYLPEACRS